MYLTPSVNRNGAGVRPCDFILSIWSRETGRMRAPQYLVVAADTFRRLDDPVELHVHTVAISMQQGVSWNSGSEETSSSMQDMNKLAEEMMVLMSRTANVVLGA